MYSSSPPKIHRKQAERYTNPGPGRLITWSTVSVPPPEYTESAPYLVGIVELDRGDRVCAQIVDVDDVELHHGLAVSPVFRRYVSNGDDGVITYGYKFTVA